LSQLPAFSVLEAISTEGIITARMTALVGYWAANDPPNAAQYDVNNLEFDPIRINQECGTYFELMVRDRVNQAARACTLAFAVGGDLDAIGSRYPGGMPRLPGETDSAYQTRIWLSPNTLTQNGVYESYVFFSLTAAQIAGTPLRDCQVQSTPGLPDVRITIMADGAPVSYDAANGIFSPFPSPVPTEAQIVTVMDYVAAVGMGRKGLTDVVTVNGPRIVSVPYIIKVWLYPGWDSVSTMLQLNKALAALIESQRFLGFSHTIAAIEGALKVGGVFNIEVDSPSKDMIIDTNAVIIVPSVSLKFAGHSGFGPLSPSS
jgi:phage-related baseplate assembly protein